MFTNIIYKAAMLAAVCFAFVSCSQEDDAVTHVDSTSGVRIQFRVAGAGETRQTDDGWDGDWHENTVERLDLFQFAANGKLKHHLLPSNMPSFEGQKGTYQELDFNELAYSELADDNTDVFYLVANCPQLEGKDDISLADLKTMMIENKLTVDGQQSSFVMDARTTRDSTDLYMIDKANKTVTLRFNLYRAAVKVCINVKDGSGKDILDGCRYKLCNFVEGGTSVLAESEAYGEGTGQGPRLTSDGYQEFKLKNGDKAVFYTYPNDWFDKTLLNEKGEFEDPTIYVKDNLIDEEKQTYVQLEVKHADGNIYYYKVPLNFSIADYNDKYGLKKEEIDKLISDHYRLNRNYFYDVTVKVDRVGGSETEPVTPEFYVRVKDWETGGEYYIGKGEFN